MLNIKNIRTSLMVEDEWMLVTIFEDEERITKALMTGATVLLVKPSDPDRLTKFMNDDNNSATIMPTIELRKMKHFHLTRLTAREAV